MESILRFLQRVEQLFAPGAVACLVLMSGLMAGCSIPLVSPPSDFRLISLELQAAEGRVSAELSLRNGASDFRRAAELSFYLYDSAGLPWPEAGGNRGLIGLNADVEARGILQASCDAILPSARPARGLRFGQLRLDGRRVYPDD